MVYSYKEHRAYVFTEEAQPKFLAVIRKARECLEMSGAVRAGILLSAAGSGDIWQNMAVVERLEELGYLARVTRPGHVAWQDELFVEAKGLP